MTIEEINLNFGIDDGCSVLNMYVSCQFFYLD